MQDPPFYPVNDFGPAMAGMVIGAIGIVHVFVAQFAVGAGALLVYLQARASWLDDRVSRRFLDSYFAALVLVAFVLGALTGVGIWLTTIQISARTIGRMVEEFHWLWAAEWAFFLLEVFAGYLFYRYRGRLGDRTRLRLLVLYAVAAWASLFLINGILSWQLTPGAWLETRSLWDGFFNPSFWPSLVYRTLVSWTLAALAATVVMHGVRSFGREDKIAMLHRTAPFFAPMALMPLVGLWFLAAIPADSRGWLFGGSVAMSMFMALAVGSSTLLGLYATLGIVARRLYINRATAVLLLALAFAATASGEFVREGVRKPYTIRGHLYSNSLTQAEVDSMRVNGSVARDPYPLRGASELANEQLVRGALVYRTQCSVCHTLAGANGLEHLAGTWQPDQLRINIAKLQHTKSFMPPFAGDARELEALVQLLLWRRAGRPADWPVSDDPGVLLDNRARLAEAGTRPGIAGAEGPR